jgi:hypothetical protein
MTTVEETIPEGLRHNVDAVLAWFNRREDVAFEVTGILNPEVALEASGTRELRLVLCGGDRCEQRSFRVTANGDGYDVALVDGDQAAADGQTPAELDPPPGARRRWLDHALSQHAFVVLVFYRGYW